MKLLVLVLALTSMCFANSVTRGTDDISLTLVNDWTMSKKCLGLDVYETGAYFIIIATEHDNDILKSYDGYTGTALGTVDLSPSNGSCFGIACDNDTSAPGLFTNDFVNNGLYSTFDSGSTWNVAENPAGISGRGMDNDGANFWEISIDGYLRKFQPGGSSQVIYNPISLSDCTGLTVFPYESNLGIAIATESLHEIHFFQWDGSDLSFMASAACPVPDINYSIGLAYAETTGTMFWSYQDSSTDWHIAEFSFDITSLQRSSWGSIKTSF